MRDRTATALAYGRIVLCDVERNNTSNKVGHIFLPMLDCSRANIAFAASRLEIVAPRLVLRGRAEGSKRGQGLSRHPLQGSWSRADIHPDVAEM